MVTSISATERIKLWNRFNTCIDHETVKTEFMRRVHRKNPPFRFKLKPKQRNCAEIPPMVEFHYKNPPPLLPSLRDVLRCERVYRVHGLPTEVNAQNLCDEIDKDLEDLREANEKVRQFEESLSTEQPNEPEVISDENPIEFHLNQYTEEPEHETNGSTVQEKELTEAEVIENIVENFAIINDEKIIEKIENKPCLSDENTQTAEENGTLNNVDEINEFEIDNSTQDSLTNDSNKIKANRKRKRTITSKSFGIECDDLLELSEEVFKSKLSNGSNENLIADTIDDQLEGLDVDVIKRLALAQLQQILTESPDLVTKYQNENANIAIKDALKAKPMKITLPSQLLSKDDIARIAEQFTNNSSSVENYGQDRAYAGVGHPIAPMPQECLYFTNGLENITDDKERALEIVRRLEKPLRESRVRARAVLTPVGDILAGKQWYTNSITDDSIFMRYRSLVIGSGHGCDLQMKNIRKCARLSSHHATVFYDEVKIYQYFIFF